MIIRLAKKLAGNFLNRMNRDISTADVWTRFEEDIPYKTFGKGSRHNWPWYFEGKSEVEIKSAHDIVTWLRGCSYVHDKVLFNEPDFWQHPLTFEKLRKGDCEDFAIWAWRKLKELNIEAELVFGRAGPTDAKENVMHAWVLLDLNGNPHLMETVNHSWKQMTFPLEEVKRRYCPSFSVDTNFKTYRYGGVIENLRLELNRTSKGPDLDLGSEN